jgi:hypothetical protein
MDHLRNAALAALTTAVVTAACGGAAKSDQPPAPASPPTTAAPPAGTAAPVAPVAPESLASLLPDLPGWTKGAARSELVTSPVAYSRAEAHYQQGESTIELGLVDSGFQPVVLAPIQLFLAPGSEERTGGTIRRAFSVSGLPGSELWTAAAHRGEVTLLVSSRFIVTATGRSVPRIDPLRAAVRAVDTNRLAALR